MPPKPPPLAVEICAPNGDRQLAGMRPIIHVEVTSSATGAKGWIRGSVVDCAFDNGMACSLAKKGDAFVTLATASPTRWQVQSPFIAWAIR